MQVQMPDGSYIDVPDSVAGSTTVDDPRVDNRTYLLQAMQSLGLGQAQQTAALQQYDAAGSVDAAMATALPIMNQYAASLGTELNQQTWAMQTKGFTASQKDSSLLTGIAEFALAAGGMGALAGLGAGAGALAGATETGAGFAVPELSSSVLGADYLAGLGTDALTTSALAGTAGVAGAGLAAGGGAAATDGIEEVIVQAAKSGMDISSIASMTGLSAEVIDQALNNLPGLDELSRITPDVQTALDPGNSLNNLPTSVPNLNGDNLPIPPTVDPTTLTPTLPSLPSIPSIPKVPSLPGTPGNGSGTGGTNPLFGGTNINSLLDLLRGAGGLDIANRLLDEAKAPPIVYDPFGSQRGQYQTQLSDLMSGKTDLSATPGYKAGLQAVDRGLAASGYLGSGQQQTALLDYGGNIYDQQVARLSTLAGAGISPQLKNNSGEILGAAQIAGQSLNSLAGGASTLLGGGTGSGGFNLNSLLSGVTSLIPTLTSNGTPGSWGGSPADGDPGYNWINQLSGTNTPAEGVTAAGQAGLDAATQGFVF